MPASPLVWHPARSSVAAEVHCVAVNVVVPLQTAVAPPVVHEQASEVVVDVPVTTELGPLLLEQATSDAIHTA